MVIPTEVSDDSTEPGEEAEVPFLAQAEDYDIFSKGNFSSAKVFAPLG